MPEISSYSPETNTYYANWETLVDTEANGYVVCAIISKGGRSWPYMVGPFDTKELAQAGQRRLRARMKREQRNYPDHTYRVFVRPLWKGDRA